MEGRLVAGPHRWLRAGIDEQSSRFWSTAATALIQEISSLRTEVQRLSHAVDFAVAPDGAFQAGLVRDLCDRSPLMPRSSGR